MIPNLLGLLLLFLYMNSYLGKFQNPSTKYISYSRLVDRIRYSPILRARKTNYEYGSNLWLLSRFIILDYIIWENRGSRKAGEFGAYRV